MPSLKLLVTSMPLAALLMAVPNAPQAAGFDVRPITIETRDGLSAVIITNAGDQKIYLETQIYDWSLDAAGQSVLSESDTAIASPPATWIAPHSTYNLRIKLPMGAPGQERAFRVLIKQLPDRSDIVAGRITFALTQSLPAFVEPNEAPPPLLSGHFIDARHISISNDGGHRARIANLMQDGRAVAAGLIGYVLAHSTLAVLLPSPVHAGTIEAETASGRQTLALQ